LSGAHAGCTNVICAGKNLSHYECVNSIIWSLLPHLCTTTLAIGGEYNR